MFKFIEELVNGKKEYKELQKDYNILFLNYQKECEEHKKTKKELQNWRIDSKILLDELELQDKRIRYLISKNVPINRYKNDIS